jgi:hypothetical protein
VCPGMSRARPRRSPTPITPTCCGSPTAGRWPANATTPCCGCSATAGCAPPSSEASAPVIYAAPVQTPVRGGHAGVEERVDLVVGVLLGGRDARVDLVVGVLLGGRDARISEEHGVENTGPAGILVVDSRREFSTLLSIECRLAGRASTNDRFSSTRARPPLLEHRAATTGVSPSAQSAEAGGAVVGSGTGYSDHMSHYRYTLRHGCHLGPRPS